MKKLYFINCYNEGNISDISAIDLSQKKMISFSTSEFEIGTSSTDGIYQAVATITLDFPYYDDILENDKNTLGFRYEDGINNIAFVIRDKKLRADGVLELKLKSTIDILTEQLNYIDIVAGEVPASSIVEKLNPYFIYDFISDPNKKIVISSEIKNDYEILKSIVEYAENWSFRENKLISVGVGLWKTQILIGDFVADLEAYYNFDKVNRAECKIATLETFRKFDNWKDKDQIQLDDVEINYPSAHPDLIYVFGDTSQGISANSRIELTPNNITQRSQFPLTKVIKNDKEYWAIINTFSKSIFPFREKYLIYKTTTNEENSNGIQLINEGVSSQKLYQYGCSYIQSLNYLPYMKVKNGLLKTFVLPGNLISRRVKITVATKTITKTIIDINEMGFLRTTPPIDLGLIQ